MTALQLTLLVIDDDLEIRDALAEVLGDEGYLVVTRPGGEEALSYLRRGHRPHVIILDLWMPRMDGWDLRSALLADPDWLDEATKTIGQFWRRKNARRQGLSTAGLADDPAAS